MAFVLIRNLKTGGTTICDELVKQGAWWVPAAERCRIGQFQEGLLNHRVVICEPEAGRRLWQGLGYDQRINHTCVGMMRNPYSRFISGWRYMIAQGCMPEQEPVGLLQNATRTPWLANLHIHRQQIRSLYGDNDWLMPELVLRTEHLQEDFDQFCELAGLKKVTLPRSNATKHKPWRDYYEEYPRLRAQVEKTMCWDVTTLPYVFDRDEPTGPLPTQLEITADVEGNPSDR